MLIFFIAISCVWAVVYCNTLFQILAFEKTKSWWEPFFMAAVIPFYQIYTNRFQILHIAMSIFTVIGIIAVLTMICKLIGWVVL